MKKQLSIGNLNLDNFVIYAPLAGCSDFPFRQMCARYKPGLMFCEMVKFEPLIRNDKKTLRYLDFDDSMRPIGGQICGSNPKIAGQAAKIIEDLGFDIIDLNCGCPVDKVTKDGSGSAMLKNVDLIGEILSEIVAHCNIPVTLKIRTGWDSENIVATEVTSIAEKAGAKAIFVHGRTRAQKYLGPANWDYIRDCKLVANTIKVIGNGGIFDEVDAENMLKETNCDGVLVARGILGKPWIVNDILDHFDGNLVEQYSFEKNKLAFLQHLNFIKNYYNEKKAIIMLRKIGGWYIKNVFKCKDIRTAISQATDINYIESLVKDF